MLTITAIIQCFTGDANQHSKKNKRRKEKETKGLRNGKKENTVIIHQWYYLHRKMKKSLEISYQNVKKSLV